MGEFEQILYEDGRFEVGAFRCPASHPGFRDAGAIRDHAVLVFPRRAVVIRQEGRTGFFCDSTTAVLYNPGQPYSREAVDPAGDASDWFALDTATARDVAGAFDPAAADARRPFRLSHVRTDPGAYLAQRRLFAAVARGGAEPLAVEESVIGLLARVLRPARTMPGDPLPAPRPHTRRAEQEAVGEARRLLALRFDAPLSLLAVAQAVGLSRFQLCRAFRRVTGTTLHAHRENLRLRAALHALGDGAEDLTALALGLGYSSHSHFTERFRRAFGVPPRAARASGLRADLRHAAPAIIAVR